jgi:hypothetical protein
MEQFDRLLGLMPDKAIVFGVSADPNPQQVFAIFDR